MKTNFLLINISVIRIYEKYIDYIYLINEKDIPNEFV